MSDTRAAPHLEPLDATFRDGARAPLHSWFPYLEGYSPRFVRQVRATWLGSARSVYEPFAGSGTTPIVLGADGVACAWAEVNPAMARIAATKLAVMAPGVDRTRLARGLEGLAAGLRARVAAAEAAEDLRASHASAFGRSVYFAPAALEAVLRLRTVDDRLHADGDTLLADCFTVAVLASLIPTSLLRRAGDLRFSTPAELAAGLPEPAESVVDKLVHMASDLCSLAPIRADAVKITSDARQAGALPEHALDGVITSPPYLNGTNYIRNARLELWYLRHLSTKAHLRALRDQVVTSGINDVDAATAHDPVTPGVEAVVARLQEAAYDPRIARMVGGYFVDMRAVLTGIRRAVRPGGRVCIDIGDSAYAGVHVPTDRLLVEVAADVGLALVDDVSLRARRSKGGAPLRQCLLVFEVPP